MTTAPFIEGHDGTVFLGSAVRLRCSGARSQVPALLGGDCSRGATRESLVQQRGHARCEEEAGGRRASRGSRAVDRIPTASGDGNASADCGALLCLAAFGSQGCVVSLHVRPEDPLHFPAHLDARSMSSLLAGPVSSYYSRPSGRCAVPCPANRRQRLPYGPLSGFILANREHSFISPRCGFCLILLCFPPCLPLSCSLAVVIPLHSLLSPTFAPSLSRRHDTYALFAVYTVSCAPSPIESWRLRIASPSTATNARDQFLTAPITQLENKTTTITLPRTPPSPPQL
jgi:hypothetical protein